MITCIYDKIFNKKCIKYIILMYEIACYQSPITIATCMSSTTSHVPVHVPPPMLSSLTSYTAFSYYLHNPHEESPSAPCALATSALMMLPTTHCTHTPPSFVAWGIPKPPNHLLYLHCFLVAFCVPLLPPNHLLCLYCFLVTFCVPLLRPNHLLCLHCFLVTFCVPLLPPNHLLCLHCFLAAFCVPLPPPMCPSSHSFFSFSLDEEKYVSPMP